MPHAAGQGGCPSLATNHPALHTWQWGSRSPPLQTHLHSDSLYLSEFHLECLESTCSSPSLGRKKEKSRFWEAWSPKSLYLGGCEELNTYNQMPQPESHESLCQPGSVGASVSASSELGCWLRPAWLCPAPQ